MSAIHAPWQEHKAVVETIGHAFCDAMSASLGQSVELGLPTNFEGDELKGKPVPLHAIVVRFGEPLRDIVVLISSLKEDVVRPLAEAGALAAAKELGVELGDDTSQLVQVEPAMVLETTDQALHEVDALYLEPVYRMALPMGEICVVLGGGLLEAATALVSGTPDHEARAEAELEEAAGMVTVPLGATADAVAGGIDDFEHLLDASEAGHAAAFAAAANANTHAVAGGEGALAAGRVDPSQWATLLSGVNVELSAELGRTDLALGDIASLVADSVLTLEQMVNEPVNVFVNGMRFATARLVVVEGEYGIEILEVVEQRQLAATLAA